MDLILKSMPKKMESIAGYWVIIMPQYLMTIILILNLTVM